MHKTDLEGAFLEGSNLTGAFLGGANLNNTNILESSIEFDYKITPGSSISCFTPTPDGLSIAVGYMNGEVKVYELTGVCTNKIEAHGAKVMDIQFSGDGNWILTAGADNLAKIHLLKSGECDNIFNRSEWDKMRIFVLMDFCGIIRR